MEICTICNGATATGCWACNPDMHPGANDFITSEEYSVKQHKDILYIAQIALMQTMLDDRDKTIRELKTTLSEMEAELDFAVHIMCAEQDSLYPDQIQYLMSARAKLDKEDKVNEHIAN